MDEDELRNKITAHMAAEAEEHDQRSGEYRDVTSCYQYRVRIIQGPAGDSWLYLCNHVTVERLDYEVLGGQAHVCLFKLVLSDAWTPARTARFVKRVEAICDAYTIEEHVTGDLTGDIDIGQVLG